MRFSTLLGPSKKKFFWSWATSFLKYPHICLFSQNFQKNDQNSGVSRGSKKLPNFKIFLVKKFLPKYPSFPPSFVAISPLMGENETLHFCGALRVQTFFFLRKVHFFSWRSHICFQNNSKSLWKKASPFLRVRGGGGDKKKTSGWLPIIGRNLVNKVCSTPKSRQNFYLA